MVVNEVCFEASRDAFGDNEEFFWFVLRLGRVFKQGFVVELKEGLCLELHGVASRPLVEFDSDGFDRRVVLSIPSDDIEEVCSLFFLILEDIENEGRGGRGNWAGEDRRRGGRFAQAFGGEKRLSFL